MLIEGVLGRSLLGFILREEGAQRFVQLLMLACAAHHSERVEAGIVFAVPQVDLPRKQVKRRDREQNGMCLASWPVQTASFKDVFAYTNQFVGGTGGDKQVLPMGVYLASKVTVIQNMIKEIAAKVGIGT